MRMVDLIEKKRDGGVLSDEEIRFIIDGFTKGDIPDYQMSAWAMAVFYKGMTDHETAVLTDAMMRSGDTIDLSRFGTKSVDKHSTGGVGDKITLPLAPLVACFGVAVPQLSGRGLGHTGGTLDKLEAMTCVCSVGLDMIAIPGDTKATTISGIIADEAAIGMVNNKTTAVRLIPVIGRKEGESVEFGGLLGYAPIIPVNRFSCEKFVARGGRIPAPIHSFKN